MYYKKILILTFLGIFSFCLISFAKEVTVISFNDFHGQVQRTTDNHHIVPGIEKFMTAVKMEENVYKNNTILVSGGDNYQGTFMSLMTFGAPVNDMFKSLDVVASAVGNHEFDWGVKYFPKWEKNTNMDYLAANIVYKKNNELVKWAKPYLIVQKNGVKVAFIGLATRETLYTTAKKNLKGLKFMDPAKAAQKWIDFLKAGKAKAGKPDVIIALTHIPSSQDTKGTITGAEINDLCNNTKGLNAVISAHSHEVVSGYINKIPVIQAGSYGEDIGILNLFFNQQNKLTGITPSIVNVGKEINNLKNDKTGTDILAKYSKKLAKYFKVIGTAKGNFTRTDQSVSKLGYFVAEVMAKSAGDQIGIVNTYGLRADLKSGKITVQDIYDVAPFDNKIYSVKMKGKDLKQLIENSFEQGGSIKGQYYGIKIFVDTNASVGKKIVKLELPDGKLLDMNKYYSIATCDFMYNGGDKFDFSKSIDKKNTGIIIKDALIKYITKHKIVTPNSINNFIKISENNELKKAA
ncbi:MAG: multifunctional 2',3'-cyclic-nucleotide 2'-phosphodiesterase/5'-nucleotidase/3'-nucleotidase [bacterium]|nr:multifunctional 2',3'-cyclic-nucleotide 2'-phosphodiesterase/5'-nucleotidase/3'-nucleotidase [bacterium]